MYRFGIVPGDARMEYLCKYLKADGYFADVTKDVSGFDVIVLPIGVKPAADMTGKIVFGGKVDGVVDYSENEYFKIRNAMPSAEGAIAIAMSSTDFTVSGAKVTVVGYGNIGKCLVDRLISLGADVTVVARREISRAEAENRGAKTIDFDSFPNTSCDILFNTVPALVVTDEVIKKLSSHSVIIDVASKPGGVDIESAKRHGIPVTHALGIPGKFAPRTAALILKSTILSMLESGEKWGIK